MRQRVALARSLAPNPRILLMDETFGALDALTREQLYGEIQQIWQKRKKTIIFVTHNIREAVCLGDRVILFSPHPGRIVNTFEIDIPAPKGHKRPRAEPIYARNHGRVETAHGRQGGGRIMKARRILFSGAAFAAMLLVGNLR